MNLVNHEDAEADGGNHHHRWVGLLQGFHLNLWMFVDLKDMDERTEKQIFISVSWFGLQIFGKNDEDILP